MLKVVGASWTQTRCSTLLIASVALMGMLTILFLEFVPRDVHDGRYAATVFWNKRTGFRIEFWGQGNDPKTIRKGVARAYYRPEMLDTGWAVLEIETQSSYPDWVQIHAAGLLEGSLSWQLIYWHWQNTIDSACDGREKFCDEINDFLIDNEDIIRDKAKDMDQEDPFWHQVNLFYEQLTGLEVGWRYAVKRSRQEDDVDIPHSDFLWMNMMCDIQDLEIKMNSSKELLLNNRPPLSLALLKLLPEKGQKFILSHATGGYYSSMLRVQKRYKFGLHYTGESRSASVPGQILSFTSYPGSLHSQDDFYRISGKSSMVVSGTALKNLNPDAWQLVNATEQVPIGPRALAANRLSSTLDEWADIISINSSGTGNKQWILLKSDDQTHSPMVWIAEQLPGMTRAGDISSYLTDIGYFISYGLPMFKDILKLGGYEEHDCEEMTAARLLLQQGQENVTDVNTMMELMRSPDISFFGRGDLLSMEDLSKQTEEFMAPSNETSPVAVQNTTKTGNITVKATPSVANNKNTQSQLDLGLFASKPHRSFRKVFKKMIALKKLRKELTGKRSRKDESDSSSSSSSESSSSSSTSSSESSAENVQSEEEKLTIHGRNRTILMKHHVPKETGEMKDLTGVIDFKIIDSDDISSFYAAAGPLYSKSGEQMIIEPFQWSKSPISEHPHNGQSDVWQFDPIQTKWVWAP